MDVAEIRARCLAKPGATASHPFGPDALVMKVADRIFAILAEDADPPSVSLKCEPEVASVLRETHAAVLPGYHLPKRHWNTVRLDGSLAARDIADWIDDSYDLVVDGLPRHVQRRLGWSRGPRGEGSAVSD